MKEQSKAIQPFQFLPVVIEDSRTLTTSLNVAKYFRKEHKHVLRDIEKLGVSESFSRSNFGRSDYVDSRGKKQKIYNMTRDGFIMLVMGYTGPTAMQIKEAYIEAFNMMEWKLSQPVREREAKMMAYYEREAVRRERKANKVSDSEIMQMIELRNKRFTVREISAQLQRSFSTVRDHLRDARKNGLLDLAPGQGWLLPEVK